MHVCSWQTKTRTTFFRHYCWTRWNRWWSKRRRGAYHVNKQLLYGSPDFRFLFGSFSAFNTKCIDFVLCCFELPIRWTNGFVLFSMSAFAPCIFPLFSVWTHVDCYSPTQCYVILIWSTTTTYFSRSLSLIITPLWHIQPRWWRGCFLYSLTNTNDWIPTISTDFFRLA